MVRVVRCCSEETVVAFRRCASVGCTKGSEAFRPQKLRELGWRSSPGSLVSGGAEALASGRQAWAEGQPKRRGAFIFCQGFCLDSSFVSGVDATLGRPRGFLLIHGCCSLPCAALVIVQHERVS